MASEETDRLFVVPPAEFVAARKALASALKAAGRREEAAAIEKRPRPSVSTWATNQVARSEPGLLRELGEVTGRLQTAGGPDYAEAIAQHRAVLKTLRAKAEAALSAAGLRAALPALAQVLQNLRAGMASPQTRPLVEAGRLLQDIATTEQASLFAGATATPGTDDRRPARAPAVADKSAPDREARETERARDKERERREQRATLQREAMRLRSGVEAAETARHAAEVARDAAEATRDAAERALAAARAAVAAAETRLSATRATLEQKSSELGRAEASLAALD
jgi:hypothetical protein